MNQASHTLGFWKLCCREFFRRRLYEVWVLSCYSGLCFRYKYRSISQLSTGFPCLEFGYYDGEYQRQKYYYQRHSESTNSNSSAISHDILENNFLPMNWMQPCRCMPLQQIRWSNLEHIRCSFPVLHSDLIFAHKMATSRSGSSFFAGADNFGINHSTMNNAESITINNYCLYRLIERSESIWNNFIQTTISPKHTIRVSTSLELSDRSFILIDGRLQWRGGVKCNLELDECL